MCSGSLEADVILVGFGCATQPDTAWSLALSIRRHRLAGEVNPFHAYAE